MPRISRSGASGGVLDLSILQRSLKSTSGRNLSRGAPSCKASSGGSGGDREASLHPRFELVVPVCDDETLFALPYCERSCSVSEELSVPSPPSGGYLFRRFRWRLVVSADQPVLPVDGLGLAGGALFHPATADQGPHDQVGACATQSPGLRELPQRSPWRALVRALFCAIASHCFGGCLR